MPAASRHRAGHAQPARLELSTGHRAVGVRALNGGIDTQILWPGRIIV
jgi:hypothetical protein